MITNAHRGVLTAIPQYVIFALKIITLIMNYFYVDYAPYLVVNVKKMMRNLYVGYAIRHCAENAEKNVRIVISIFAFKVNAGKSVIHARR